MSDAEHQFDARLKHTADRPQPIPLTEAAAPVVATQRWYAVCSQSNREEYAALEVAKQGFAVYLPRRLKTVRHARRTTTQMAPLFPRYLFVRMDPTRDRWRCIDSTYGVSHLVRFTDKPTAIPQGIVETLMAMSDSRGIVDFQEMLGPGRRVLLAAGPFADRLGTLQRLDGAGSVRVLLEMMGRCVEVSTRRDFILPA